ncbi:MAG: prephenate dehydratase [Actinobacteria bacterium]|nr:prephenate dehydratase [Actinomycetota bacterium]
MSTYAYLGPVGTFTEAALRKVTSESDTLVPYANVTAALNAVRTGETVYALVPIENSIEGVVARTLDELATGEPLVISGEVTLPVSFALMGRPGTKNIKRIATHPHAEAQCRTYIAVNYPDAEVIATASTAGAAEAISRGEFDAAIAAPVAATHYNLEIIANDIGDNLAAVTRFVLVTKPGALPQPTGHDRTSLAAFIGIDHAGALLEVLTEFAVRGVNLTFIQSRPTGLELGHYHFIIDAEGHINEARVGDALTGLRRICEDIRFLGSYPRADKVIPTSTARTSDIAFEESTQWLNSVRRGEAT